MYFLLEMYIYIYIPKVKTHFEVLEKIQSLLTTLLITFQLSDIITSDVQAIHNRTHTHTHTHTHYIS